jgi:hypothetical protein
VRAWITGGSVFRRELALRTVDVFELDGERSLACTT